MGLIQSNDDLKIKDLRFPEEGILPQNCKIEILPKFSACCPALQISVLPAPLTAWTNLLIYLSI